MINSVYALYNISLNYPLEKIEYYYRTWRYFENVSLHNKEVCDFIEPILVNPICFDGSLPYSRERFK